jgi:6-phosphogluconolactonase (cycloisomerase 2 family)
MSRSVFAYVGCRTTRQRHARGKGIAVFAVDPDSGAWEPVDTFEPLENPSFLTLGAAQNILYAVHGDGTEVSSFTIDAGTGRLSLLNRQPCGGINPVHLALSRTGDALVIVNYATGSAVQLPIGADGALGPVRSLVSFRGDAGPHRVEQVSSHPHHVNRFDNDLYHTDWHIVPDKGLDTVFAVKWCGVGDAVITGSRCREGSGPRHATFHPALPIVYVANELDATLTAWSFDPVKGALIPRHTTSLLPPDYHGQARAAGITVRPDGSMLYVSLRGFDRIASVILDRVTGWPLSASWTATYGKCPRFLCLSHHGQMLYVANEQSDAIVQYRVDADSGELSPSGHVVNTASPVCIAFKYL